MGRRKARSEPVAAAADEEAAFIAAIRKTPADSNARVAYADWLDEHDRPYEAAVQRDRAGVSELWYRLRRKSDGLFSDGRRDKGGSVIWSTSGKRWRSLKELGPHMRNMYGSYDWADLEVVVIEIRPQDIAILPITIHHDQRYSFYKRFTIDEPRTQGLLETSGESTLSQSERSRAARKR